MVHGCSQGHLQYATLGVCAQFALTAKMFT
jgi:hypothetical protein